MHVDGLFVGRSSGSQQGVNERRQAIRFADDDVGVFVQLLVVQLPFQELRRAAYAAQRVLDLMGKLPNHLAAGAMLNQQSVLAADLRAPRDVSNLDEHAGVGRHDRRDAAIHGTFVCVHLRAGERDLVRVVITGSHDATEDVAHLRLIVNELQQGFTLRSSLTDTEDVLRGRVHADDQQVLVQQHDPGTQRVEDNACISVQCALAGRAGAARSGGWRCA